MQDGSFLALVVSSLILIATYAVTVGARRYRTLAAFVCAVVMVLAGQALSTYDQSLALAAIDFSTLALLFGLAPAIAHRGPYCVACELIPYRRTSSAQNWQAIARARPALGGKSTHLMI